MCASRDDLARIDCPSVSAALERESDKSTAKRCAQSILRLQWLGPSLQPNAAVTWKLGHVDRRAHDALSQAVQRAAEERAANPEAEDENAVRSSRLALCHMFSTESIASVRHSWYTRRKPVSLCSPGGVTGASKWPGSHGGRGARGCPHPSSRCAGSTFTFLPPATPLVTRA